VNGELVLLIKTSAVRYLMTTWAEKKSLNSSFIARDCRIVNIFDCIIIYSIYCFDM